MNRKWHWVGILLLVGILIWALPDGIWAQGVPPLQGPDVWEIQQAVQLSIDESDHLYTNIFTVGIDKITCYDNWAVVTLNLYEPDTGELVPTEAGIALAWKERTTWKVALPGDEIWATQIPLVPEVLLPESMKEHLISRSTEAGINQGQAYGGYYLPWPKDVTHRLTRSISHGCPGTECYAFDFADSADPLFEITAARSGEVWYAVWTYPNGYWDGNSNHANYIVVKNDIGLYDVYLHLAYDSIPAHLRTRYAPVLRGEKVGNADDTGNSTGHHLHFQAHTNANSWYGASVDITFDDVSVCGGRPRLKTEDACATTNEYTSGNARPDVIPPTTSHALPGATGENGWYTSAVQVTLNASDNSGGSGVKLTQYRVDGGSWQTYGGPFTVSGEGSHTVYYQSQDNAGNWEAEKSVTFRLDTVAPAAPTQAASGCAAQSNVWQNSCADPSFTFSGASDATSGIAGYQLYWGSDPNGTSDYWTGSPTFDPGAPGEGTFYLRARVKDQAGHWSGWVTLFTFRYDATAPTGAVTINQNASVTYATLVRLFPSGSDALSGPDRVRFRDAGGAWSNWVSLGTTLWQLPGPTGQTFSVEMQVRDRAGNESAVYADNIALNIYPARPASGGYRLTRSTWGAAAVERASAGYRLLSTLGQPSLIGSLMSSSYRLTSGYWAGYRPMQRIYLPLVLRNR